MNNTKEIAVCAFIMVLFTMGMLVMVAFSFRKEINALEKRVSATEKRAQ